MNKRITLLLAFGVIALVGAGCAVTQTENDTNSNTNKETVAVINIESVEEIVDSEPEEAEVEATEEVVEVNDAEEDSEEANAIDTSDWVSYTNDEYGLSFQYPSDYRIDDLSEANQRLNSAVQLLLGIRKKGAHPSDHEMTISILAENIEVFKDQRIESIETSINRKLVSESTINIEGTIYTELLIQNMTTSAVSRTLLREISDKLLIEIGYGQDTNKMEQVVNSLEV